MKQGTDKQNRNDPVNATGGNSKSPTHGQANKFLKDDNNSHHSVFPLKKARR